MTARWADPGGTFRPWHVFDTGHDLRTFEVQRVGMRQVIDPNIVRRGACVDTVSVALSRAVSVAEHAVERELWTRRMVGVGPTVTTIEVRSERRAIDEAARLDTWQLEHLATQGLDRVVVALDRQPGR